MLMPKRTKYRKQMKGRNRGKSARANSLAYGEYGIKALEHGRIDSRQIEAARVAMTRAIKRQGKVWIMVFPHKPLTKRPLEVRMGKGKGPIDKWVMNIKPGRVCLFELKAKLKTMQLTNTSELRACKKDIAQIQTAITAAKN